MDHVKALGIKFIATAIAVLSIFGIFGGASIGNLLFMAAMTTIISYLIGDQFVLRQLGNVIATFSDFGLNFVLLWALGTFFFGPNQIIAASLFAAFFITCTEPFIHAYIADRQFPDERRDRRTFNELQTEFAEETNERDIQEDQKNKDI